MFMLTQAKFWTDSLVIDGLRCNDIYKTSLFRMMKTQKTKHNRLTTLATYLQQHIIHPYKPLKKKANSQWIDVILVLVGKSNNTF